MDDSVGAMMMGVEEELAPLIRQGVHEDMQMFIQRELGRPLRKAMKRDRKTVFNCMVQMRDIAGDWQNQEHKEDYKKVKDDLVKVWCKMSSSMLNRKLNTASNSWIVPFLLEPLRLRTRKFT